MQDKEQYIYQNIIQEMKEGVLVVSMDGKIAEINPAGYDIMKLDPKIIGKSLVLSLMDERNDSFTQTILDSVYDKGTSHNAVVDYYDGMDLKKLFVSTSYLRKGNEKIGITVVMNDVTELMELKDAMIAMKRIKQLNIKLEKRNEFIKKTFGRYLSDTIVEQILDKENGMKIGGEKKEIVILFSDLRGFTTMSEVMEPQDLIRMLNHYLESMIDCIMKWEGVILEFIGDAILAVFGALSDDSAAADHGVQCGAEMQVRMQEINRFNSEQRFPELEMGIGIHFGEVIIGNIGSEQKAKYDIIGRNVNLASRIESYTVGGQILISEEMNQAVTVPLWLRGEKCVHPKGVSKPIRLYDVGAAANVSVPYEEHILEDVVPPAVLKAEIIQGKSIEDNQILVTVKKCSRKRVVLDSSFPFETDMNLKLEKDGEILYAKIIECGEEVLAHITYGTLADKIK